MPSELSRLSVGDSVVIDLPISQRLHRKRGVIHSRYHMTSLESWWVLVDGYTEEDGPCWFSGSELQKVDSGDA